MNLASKCTVITQPENKCKFAKTKKMIEGLGATATVSASNLSPIQATTLKKSLDNHNIASIMVCQDPADILDPCGECVKPKLCCPKPKPCCIKPKPCCHRPDRPHILPFPKSAEFVEEEN